MSSPRIESRVGWVTIQLVDALETLENGSRPTGGIKEIEHGIPSLGGEHLDKNGGFKLENISLIPEGFYRRLRRGKVKKQDVLLVKDGATTGKVSIVRDDFPFEEAAVNEHIFILRGKKEIVDQKFLYYHLLSERGQRQIAASFHGAAIGGINTQFARNYTLSLPPLSHQREIAETLDRVHAARVLRAQGDGLTNAYLRSALAEVIGSRRAQTKIREIAKLVSSGSTPLGGERTYLKSGVTFIRSQNVLMNKLDLSDAVYISNETHRSMKRTWVKDNDVLLNITGASLGRVAVYHGLNDGANVNQHVCIIRLDRSQALPEYVSSYLATPAAQSQIWTIQAGASRQALNFEQVKSLDVYLPSLPEQELFVRQLSGIQKAMEDQRQSNEHIDKLFQSLMQRTFMSGLA